MIKLTKILLFFAVLAGTAYSALADKGIGKKTKNKVALNITTTSAGTLKQSVTLNLKTGLKYTGSLLVNQQPVGNSISTSSLLTYQKGNTVYIIPQKHFIAVPEISQGYTGMKLIIRPH
jgi:hypothetical protein